MDTDDDDMHARFLEWRGVEDVCEKCRGSGRLDYPDTSTWGHGTGGQMITSDVCEYCWGSGDRFRKGANLREYSQIESVLRKQVKALKILVEPKQMNEIPRRNRLDLNTPAEMVIRHAVEFVERVGAHQLLTEAVILLGQAREKVADYVDMEQAGRPFRMTPEKAIEVIAQHVLAARGESVAEAWDLYPEIGERDWESIANKVHDMRSWPSQADYDEAYALLTKRANNEPE